MRPSVSFHQRGPLWLIPALYEMGPLTAQSGSAPFQDSGQLHTQILPPAQPGSHRLGARRRLIDRREGAGFD